MGTIKFFYKIICIFLINPLFCQEHPQGDLTNFTKEDLKQIKESLERAEKVMSIIKSIAPDLWQEIKKVDSTGINHVKEHKEFNVGATLADQDCLPIIFIHPFYLNLPLDEVTFIIGHELGHYVSGHIGDEPFLFHHALNEEEKKDQETVEPKEFRKGRKIAGQLSFESTLKKAYERTKEDEADRFSILQFGTSIDAGISFGERMINLFNNKPKNEPEKETFKRAHKFWFDRIKHLESLRREVEIRKNRKPTPINWKGLVENYKKLIWPIPQPTFRPIFADVKKNTEKLSKFTAILPKKLPKKSRIQFVNDLIKKYNMKNKTKNVAIGAATMFAFASLGTPGFGLAVLTGAYAIKRYKNRKQIKIQDRR